MPRKEKKSIKKPKRKNPTTFEPDKAKKRKRQKKLVLGVKNTTGKLFFQIAIPKESNTFFCRRLFSFGFLGDPCAVMPTGFLFVPLHGSSWAFDPKFPLAFCWIAALSRGMAPARSLSTGDAGSCTRHRPPPRLLLGVSYFGNLLWGILLAVTTAAMGRLA